MIEKRREKNMEYVIKLNQAVFTQIQDNKSQIILKNCILSIIGIIVVCSLLFDFGELSWSVRLFLMSIIFTFSGEKKEYIPYAMELYFNDDYCEIHTSKEYYSIRRLRKKEIFMMKYSEISKCVFKTKSNRIQIYGNGKSQCLIYNKDGSLLETQTEEHHFTNGMICCNTQFATEIDFIKEIENHFPLKVKIENN